MLCKNKNIKEIGKPRNLVIVILSWIVKMEYFSCIINLFSSIHTSFKILIWEELLHFHCFPLIPFISYFVWVSLLLMIFITHLITHLFTLKNAILKELIRFSLYMDGGLGCLYPHPSVGDT
jgi:hypothetical protein